MEKKRLLKASVTGETRLDIYIKEAASIDRKAARALIDSGKVCVNGEVQAKYHRLVRPGDDVSYNMEVKEKQELKPYAAELEILYEDPEMIAVNKPAGMLVHPTKFREHDTLVNAVMAKYGVKTAHPANRLDRETSGIVFVALNSARAQELSTLFEKRQVKKEYLCLVHGKMAKKGEIKIGVSKGGGGIKSRETVEEGGHEAHTIYEPVEVFDHATLLKIVIKTGRTHQIRSHMRFIKHPVIGDTVYGDGGLDEALFGAGKSPGRQMLHSAFTEFTLAGKEVISVKAPLPKDFEEAIKHLKARMRGV